MKWKCSKVLNSHIFGHYVQFSAPVTHSKDPYTSKIVQPRPHILPKVYINLYYQKMYSFPTFVMYKSVQKLHICSF